MGRAGLHAGRIEWKTRAQRQWRFETVGDIDAARVKAYLLEAMENQERGKAVKPAPKKALSIPR